MSIIIDKEFESLIPSLSDDEFRQLEANCVRDGIRDPLVVWPQDDGNDILVDGHNRFRISAMHAGIRFDIKRMEFKDRDEAKIWIIKNQLGRRNLPLIDRVTLEDRKKNILAEQAKKKLGGDHKSEEFQKSKDKNSCPLIPRQEKRENSTDYKIAKAAGTSEDTVRKVRAINKKATDRTKQLVREGKLSINQAYNSVHPKKPNPIKEMVKEAKAEHEQYLENKKSHTVDFAKAQEDKKNQSIIHNDLLIEIYKMLEKIENFGFNHKPAELDGLVDDMDETERTALMDRLEKCDGILTKVQIAFIKN